MTTTHEPTADPSLSPHDSPSRADSRTTRSLTPGHPTPSPTAGQQPSSGVDPADYEPALHDAALDQATPLAVPTLTNSPGCTPATQTTPAPPAMSSTPTTPSTPTTSAAPAVPEPEPALEPTPQQRFRAVPIDAWSLPASSVQWSRPRATLRHRAHAADRRTLPPLNRTAL